MLVSYIQSIIVIFEPMLFMKTEKAMAYIIWTMVCACARGRVKEIQGLIQKFSQGGGYNIILYWS